MCMPTYATGEPRPNSITHQGGRIQKHSKDGRGHSTNETSILSIVGGPQ